MCKGILSECERLLKTNKVFSLKIWKVTKGDGHHPMTERWRGSQCCTVRTHYFFKACKHGTRQLCFLQSSVCGRKCFVNKPISGTLVTKTAFKMHWFTFLFQNIIFLGYSLWTTIYHQNCSYLSQFYMILAVSGRKAGAKTFLAWSWW